jgi:hypothetical protein
MMEKQGIVAPHVTPAEDGDTAKTAAQIKRSCETPEAELQAIRELDGDFRKAAAEATKKSLR